MIWSIKNFLKYKDLLKQLVVRDIKLKYRRSFLGYVWSVLNPLLTMSVMVVVFSALFRSNIHNFAVYALTGQMMFNFMAMATQGSMFSIIDNSSLIKKSYVPKYIFVMSRVTSSLVDFVFSLGALIIVMLVTKSQFSFYNILMLFVALQLYVFSLGLGMFLSAANVFFRDIQYIYNAILTAWTYLTPLFYPIDILPDIVKSIVVNFNPMYLYIQQFRDVIYDNCLPAPHLVFKGILTAIVMLIIGCTVFYKSQDKFILYI